MKILSNIFRQNKPYMEYEIINPNPEVERQIEQGQYPGLMITRKPSDMMILPLLAI